MNNRSMLTVNAVAIALFGAAFMLIPEWMLSQFKTENYVATVFVVRFLGGAMLLAGWFLWLLKDLANAKLQKTLAMVMFACSLLGFVMTILGMTSVGVIRANGWLLLVIHGGFALAYAYMFFLLPRMAEPKQKHRSPRKAKENVQAGENPPL